MSSDRPGTAAAALGGGGSRSSAGVPEPSPTPGAAPPVSGGPLPGGSAPASPVCPLAVSADPPSPAAGDGGRRGRARRGYFVPGVIALLAMAAIGAAVNFSGVDHQSPSRLDGNNVAVAISQGLQAERHLRTPPAVTCPSSEPVRAGLGFTCQWHEGPRDQAVRVTETDSRGQYDFSVPPPG